MNFKVLEHTIKELKDIPISEERKEALLPLIVYIQDRLKASQTVRLNFICTHNSRRSHLGQIWAQTLAHYLGIENVNCYSGGTEETAMFPKVVETLEKQGFIIRKLTVGSNPVYTVKYTQNAHPVVAFSKKYDAVFNPVSEFGAIMTCASADEGCPFIPGAAVRLPIRYEDPKIFDNHPEQNKAYWERSLQIASEMYFVFSSLN